MHACTSLNPQGTPLGPLAPAAPVLPEQQQAGRATLLPTCQPTLPSDISGAVFFFPLQASLSYPIGPDDDDDLRPPNAVATAAPSTNQSTILLLLPVRALTSEDDDDDDDNTIQ